MAAPEVFSLAPDEIDAFLDRRRYAPFVPIRLQVDAFLREILAKACAFVPAGAGSILMDRPLERGPTPDTTELHFVAVFGPAAAELVGGKILAGNGIAGHVYRTGRAYRMQDTDEDPHFDRAMDDRLSFTTRSVVAVPIYIEETVCGVLELINRQGGGAFTAKDLELLEIFAGYTSVSIENLLDAQRANEMARLDDLTGLYNDRFFHHRLTEDLTRSDAEGGCLALIFLDLDDFKDVNDTHGHLAGSQVLKEFGYLLRRTIRVEGATIARYGGDEFVIILPGHDERGGFEIARGIQRDLATATFLKGSFSWADEPVEWRRTMTCSLGVAVYPEHVPRTGSVDRKKNRLLRAADQAMYAAKAQGKNLARVAEPVDLND